MISVKLHATLRPILASGIVGPQMIELPEFSTLGNLMALFKLTYDDAIIVVVNHKIRDVEWTLNDGDNVDIIPAISGG